MVFHCIIIGYFAVIQHCAITEEKQKYFIGKTFAQAKRLSMLVEEISVLNKIEESSGLFVFEKVKLLSVINEVTDSLKINLEQKNIKVITEIPEDLTLKANKSLMHSVFFNLTDNAVKYAGENILINITNYQEDKKYYYFSFSNTGQSIDKEHFPRIFERFYRIDSGRSRKTGGTGLGLAIVKNAIELHAGEISIRNKENGGVEFLFSLAK